MQWIAALSLETGHYIHPRYRKRLVGSLMCNLYARKGLYWSIHWATGRCLTVVCWYPTSLSLPSAPEPGLFYFPLYLSDDTVHSNLQRGTLDMYSAIWCVQVYPSGPLRKLLVIRISYQCDSGICTTHTETRFLFVWHWARILELCGKVDIPLLSLSSAKTVPALCGVPFRWFFSAFSNLLLASLLADFRLLLALSVSLSLLCIIRWASSWANLHTTMRSSSNFLVLPLKNLISLSLLSIESQMSAWCFSCRSPCFISEFTNHAFVFTSRKAAVFWYLSCVSLGWEFSFSFF